MLMYATQLRNIEVIIPNHKERITYLVQQLQDHLSPDQSKTELVNQQDDAATQASDSILEVAKGFRQEADRSLPKLIGHQGIRKAMEDHLKISSVLGHLIAKDEMVGFRSLLLFGPPGAFLISCCSYLDQ